MTNTTPETPTPTRPEIRVNSLDLDAIATAIREWGTDTNGDAYDAPSTAALAPILALCEGIRGRMILPWDLFYGMTFTADEAEYLDAALYASTHERAARIRRDLNRAIGFATREDEVRAAMRKEGRS